MNSQIEIISILIGINKHLVRKKMEIMIYNVTRKKREKNKTESHHDS